MDSPLPALKTRKYIATIFSATRRLYHSSRPLTSSICLTVSLYRSQTENYLENVNKKFVQLNRGTKTQKCQCGMSYKHLHPACNIKQPFKGLESWIVLSSVLGYWGYKYDVHDVLRQISKKTRSYLWSHHRPLLDYSLTAAPAQRTSQLKLTRQLKKTVEKSHYSRTGFSFSAFADFEGMENGVTMIFKLNDDAVFKVRKHDDELYDVSFIPRTVTDYKELRSMADLTLRQDDEDKFVTQTIRAMQQLESDSSCPKNFFIHRGFALAGFEGHTYISTRQQHHVILDLFPMTVKANKYSAPY